MEVQQTKRPCLLLVRPIEALVYSRAAGYELTDQAAEIGYYMLKRADQIAQLEGVTASDPAYMRYVGNIVKAGIFEAGRIQGIREERARRKGGKQCIRRGQ